MEAITLIRSRTVVMPAANIDTDQILPARFLTTTSRDGLGQHLFADWRYESDGSPKTDFILNRPQARGCGILVAGPNIGCGSSREHAPWALRDYGFRAVVSTQIADIFRGNCLKNGVLPVVVDAETCAWLLAHPGVEIEIDLQSTTLRISNGVNVKFSVEAFARYCLLNGLDELDFLLSLREKVDAFQWRRSGASAPAGE